MRGAYLLKKCRQRYGFLLLCDSFIQSFTFTLHCLQPTVIFSLLEWSSRLNVTFVLTLQIERTHVKQTKY